MGWHLRTIGDGRLHKWLPLICLSLSSVYCLVGEHGVSSLSQTSKQNGFPAVTPAARERVSDSREKKPSLREAQRLRRRAIFREWDKGGTFAEIGRKFGLTRIRTRQIVLKAVMGDGCRSERARAWMAQLDEKGFGSAVMMRDFRKARGRKRRAACEQSARKQAPRLRRTFLKGTGTSTDNRHCDVLGLDSLQSLR